MEFRLYTKAEAEEYFHRFNEYDHTKTFETEEKEIKVTDVWISKSGWNIKLNGVVQPGFYVTIALENGKNVNPIYFNGFNSLKKDFSAKHLAVDFDN